MTIFFRSLIYPELNKIFNTHTPAPKTFCQKIIHLFYHIVYGYQPGSAEELVYLRTKAISALNTSSNEKELIRYSQAFKTRTLTLLSQPPEQARIGSLIHASLQDASIPLNTDKKQMAVAAIRSHFGSEPFPYVKTALVIGMIAALAFATSYLTPTTPVSPPSAPPLPTTKDPLPEAQLPEPTAEWLVSPSLRSPFWPLDTLNLSPYQLKTSLISTANTLQFATSSVALPLIQSTGSTALNAISTITPHLFTTTGAYIVTSAALLVLLRKTMGMFNRVQEQTLSLVNQQPRIPPARQILEGGIAAIPRPIGFYQLAQQARGHGHGAANHAMQIGYHVIKLGKEALSPTWWLPIHVIKHTAAIFKHATGALEETALTASTVPGFLKLFYDRYLGANRGITPYPAFEYAENDPFHLTAMTRGNRHELSTPIPAGPITFFPPNSLKKNIHLEEAVSEYGAQEAEAALHSIPLGTLPTADALLLAQFCNFANRSREYHLLQTQPCEQSLDAIVHNGSNILRILKAHTIHAQLPLFRRALDYLMLLSHNLEIADPDLPLIDQIRSHFQEHSSTGQRDLEQIRTYLAQAFNEWHPHAQGFLPIFNPFVFKEMHPHSNLWGMVHAEPSTLSLSNHTAPSALPFNPHLQAVCQSLLLHPLLSLQASSLLLSSASIPQKTRAHILQSDSIHQGSIGPDAGALGAQAQSIPWIGLQIQSLVQSLAKQRNPLELPQTLIRSLAPSLHTADQLLAHLEPLAALSREECEQIYTQDPSIKEVLAQVIAQLRHSSHTLSKATNDSNSGLKGLAATYQESASSEYQTLLANIASLQTSIGKILPSLERIHHLMPVGAQEVPSLPNSPDPSSKQLHKKSPPSSPARSSDQETDPSTPPSVSATQAGSGSSSNHSDHDREGSRMSTPDLKVSELPPQLQSTVPSAEACQNNE